MDLLALHTSTSAFVFYTRTQMQEYARAALSAQGRQAEPVATTEFTLRAMAMNYSKGHAWDHLDTLACIQAADEIKALRVLVAAQAPAELLPKGWRIEREPRDVLALHRVGTGQPYRYEPGDVVHSLLSDIIGNCTECGGKLEYEDGEPWDGPSVGCVECGTVAAAQASTVPTEIINNLLDLARIVDRAVTDWGESFADGSSDVKFHKAEAEARDAILDYFDALPDGPDENVIESGPVKAARILGASK